jgi:dihydroorotase
VDIHVRNGTIAGLGESLPAPAGAREKDLSGCFLSPGLIDLHGHWYEGSSFGINPDLCLQHGATTVVDAGTTGFVNFPEFRATRMAKTRIEVLAFVNVAALGIPTAWMGELEDLRFARPKETIEIIEENSDVAVGVKVRMRSGHSHAAFGLALEAAEATHVPLMVHIGPTAQTADILRRLRPGDVLTHCFEGRGDGILDGGNLLPEALQARKEGVVFDVGHGCGSFSWATARKAFELFFYPDTISTDLHRYSVERWAFDMPTIMTKFLHLGMSLEEIILKSTWMPAKVLKREHQIGTLKAGTVADLFVFSLEEGEFPLEDTHMKIETASRRIKPRFTLKAGEITEAEHIPNLLRKLRGPDYDVFKFLHETA